MIIPSKWVILKWCSLWNDIWLSLRNKRQRPQSFWNALWLSLRNDISKANCLLHAFGVFRVLTDWILTKFNRQEPGWKIVCQSFWDDLWLSFRNEQRNSVFVSIWYMTVISKWRRKNFRTENHFRQRGCPKFSWRKCSPNPYFRTQIFSQRLSLSCVKI